MRLLLLLSLLFTLSRATSALPSSSPTPEHLKGEILFTSNRDGNKEIYTMRADGSQQKRLTVSTYDNFSPQWNPDKRYILFFSKRETGNGFYLMNADGSGVRKVGKGNEWYVGFIGPERLMFFTNTGTENSIVARNLNGTDEKTLFETDEDMNVEIRFPCVSPDYSKIVYTMSIGVHSTLGVMNVDGTGQRLLYPSEAMPTPQLPMWNPNGQQIFFTDGSQSTLWRVNLDGSYLTPITKTDISNVNSYPVVSPDGQKLAYATEIDKDDEIFGSDPDGNNVRRLTDTKGFDGRVEWNAQSTHFAFASARSGVNQIYVMPFAGGEAQQLTSVGSNFLAEWRP